MNEPATAVAPFVVRGRVGGVVIERAAYTTDQAEELTQHALATGADTCSWMVRPVDEHAAVEPVVLFTRYRAGRSGETHRAVHAVVVLPGRLLATTLLASCGVHLPRENVEFVAPGDGMPCIPCTALLAADTSPLPEPTTGSTPQHPLLDELHPELADLLAQLGHPAGVAPHRSQSVLPPPARTERCPR